MKKKKSMQQYLMEQETKDVIPPETITVGKFQIEYLLTSIQESLVLFSLLDKSDLARDTMGMIAEFRKEYDI